jgi:hypothetical protein
VSVISTLHEPLDYAYTPLFLCIISCYSYCLCFSRYYHHHHRIASDKLMVHHVVIHLLLWSTHHQHLPSLMLLLVCHVANVVIISLLCCLCHGEQFGKHMIKIPYVGFFFVSIITKMLMWNAFKPWVVFFVTIVQSCFVSLKLKQGKV